MATGNFFVLAPEGQVKEGFLSIFTHRCQDGPRRLRCMDDIDASWSAELAALTAMVRRFYADVYAMPALFYEQGRGGGTRSHFEDEDFWFHPHLCALPSSYNPAAELDARYERHVVEGVGHIRDRCGRRPYLFVGGDGVTTKDHAWTTAPGSAVPVERFKLKRAVVEAEGLPTSADWRVFPGREEIDLLVAKFDHWYYARGV